MNANTTDMTVANTILQQLGGGRFQAMVGMKSPVGGAHHVQFGIGSGAKDKINKVRIELAADDTYTVSFWNIRGASMKLVSTVEGVYADNLQAVFTSATGFQTKL